MLNGGIPAQVDLEKLEDWASRNLMKFSQEKYQVLPLGWNKSSTRTCGRVEEDPEVIAEMFIFRLNLS